MKAGVLFWGVLLLLLPSVLSVGYAPILIGGVVVDDGQPVPSVAVWMKAYDDEQEVFMTDSFISTERGFFFHVLSVPSDFVGAVQITLMTGEKTYVEVLYDVEAWHEYDIVIDLRDDSLGMVSSEKRVGDAVQSISDEELKRIVEGTYDQDLLDKYDLEIADRIIPRGPETVTQDEVELVEEQPRKVDEDSSSRTSSFRSREWLIVIGIVLALGISVILMSRRHHK